MSPATALPQLRPAESPGQRLRVVTAASLFDGHDAAINIMRRLLQAQGAEVIHLGHDRSVEEIVEAAVQEDAHAVAISSYQGGHLEFFRYLIDRLRAVGAGHVRVYGGGGGTITAAEAAELQAYGVARIFRPEDGREFGLEGMIRWLVDDCAQHPRPDAEGALARLAVGDPVAVARLISQLEEEPESPASERLRRELESRRGRARAPVIGFTGTGGSGKSSVVDEVVSRFRLENPERSVGLLLVDPSRRRSGGALLGDRIRMNAIHGPGIFARSLATRRAHLALSRAAQDAVRVLQAAGFDLILLETAGIGQSDSDVIDLADRSVYVMTPEYGAPSQLEKIDMLDLADLVVLNKADRRGAADALRDVRKQWRRNHDGPQASEAEVPVFPTVARRWNDPGLDRLYAALHPSLLGEGAQRSAPLSLVSPAAAPEAGVELIPGARTRYLAEIADCVRGFHAETDRQAGRAADAWACQRSLGALSDPAAAAALRGSYESALQDLDPELRRELLGWPEIRARYQAETQTYQVRGRPIRVANRSQTLAHTPLAKVALPRSESWGELTQYLRRENLPGHFPFTAGVTRLSGAERCAPSPSRLGRIAA